MRIKTTVMLPTEVARLAASWGRRLGVGKNGFLSMGAVFMLAQMSLLDSKQKRLKLLRDLEVEFQTIVEEARKAA